MIRTRVIIGVLCLLSGVNLCAVANDARDQSIDDLLGCEEYSGSPLDAKLDQLEEWMDFRDAESRDAEWARAASEKVSVLARQGDFSVAEVYADAILEDMLMALGDDGDFIAAAYSVGFVKVYTQKVDETLLLIDRMRTHPAFDSNPVYHQYVDTLMVAVHTQTGNPILAAGVFIEKYNDGTIEELPLLDQIKLISNISYALIRGRAYTEAQSYLDVAAEKLKVGIASGELEPVSVRRVRWHTNYNRAEMLFHQGKYEEMVPLYPTLKEDADNIGGPLYAVQTAFVEAAIAYFIGDHDRAAGLITRAIDETKKLSATDSLLEFYTLQAMNYKAAGRAEEALSAYLERKAIDDDLKAEQGRARVEYMNTRRLLLERNAQIKELEAQTNAAFEMRRRDQIIAVVASTGLTLVLLFAAALIRSRRRLRSYADDLEASEKKAQIAAQAKSAFLANMSHEIRTPLNGLLGMTQVLAEKSYDQEHDECVDIILRSGESLLTIVNDVLDLSKIEAGKMTVTPEATNIQDLVDDVVSLWTVSAREKGIDLIVDVDPSLPDVAMFDGDRVRQCASNLVSNAIKFTETGHVALAARTPDNGSTLAISVEDTGLGIKDDVLDTLFSAFEQGDKSSTRKFGGTGLGLSIVHSFADLMGGEVTVSSVYGEGSRFELSIPMTPVKVEPKRPSPAAAVALETAPTELEAIKTILLVDDNQVNRMVVKAFLKDTNVSIAEAENGREALDYLNTVGSADLILLDMHMPEMDGPTCIEHIRASEAPWRDVPILVLTADAMEGDRERYMKFAVQGYLAKPVVQKVLWSEILRIDDMSREEGFRKTA